jgi:hypothetical protein
MELTVLQSAYATSGQYLKPPAGYVWVAFEVKLTAEADNQTASVSNFTVLSDGSEQGQIAITDVTAWQPELSISTLNTGQSVTGWIVYAVPTPKSFVELDYTTSILGGPPDLILRSACCSQ